MIIRVKLFAAARDRVGQNEVAVEVAAGATVGQLRSTLSTLHPRAASVLGAAAFAVDQRYVDDGVVIDQDSEVACIPPVSGG